MIPTLLADFQIRFKNIIQPFEEHTSTVNGKPVLSYGVSSYGYDLRLSSNLLYLPSPRNGVDCPVDPMNYQDDMLPLLPNEGGQFIIEPHGFVLGASMERLVVPENVLGICLGKSTYARVGLQVNVTPAEPGWQGYLTIELHNPTTRSIVIYPEQGICQMVFFEGDKPQLNYAARLGKYQDQPDRPIGPKMYGHTF
jgi:dCTP deaminase